MATDFQNWIGRTEEQKEFASKEHLTRISALLDNQTSHWQKNTLPPLAHWFFCQPIDKQSNIDIDGHIKRGGFIPPIDLPRRMWAGSYVEFIEPLPLEEILNRRSQIAKITPKTNKNNESLIFLTIEHEITGKNSGHIKETQNIVYKSDSKTKPIIARAAPIKSEKFKEVEFDITQLFRFSALSNNAHRIHFDMDYAKIEGYPGLVVHGPYLAFLLLDHYISNKDNPKKFSFRAESPLFDAQRAKLCFADSELWVEHNGAIIMSAKIS